MAKATFGAGCFWGVEAAFRRIAGVTGTAVGYMGGQVERPSYEMVCTDRSGHVEVVEVEYDPAIATYESLLEVFWSCHNPTQVNRQGPDFGTQYRTVIFVHDAAQRAAAEHSREALAASGRHRQPIATTIENAQTFWRAEDYHQQYLEKRGLAHCHL